MRSILIFLLIFCSEHLHSQTQLDAEKVERNNPWVYSFWDTTGFQLPDLLHRKDTFHLRYWGVGNVIDIWSNDLQTFQGQQITHTNARFEDKEKYHYRYKTEWQKKALDTFLSKQVYQLYLPISNIPADDENSKIGRFDGFTYIMEISNADGYICKDYWSPDYYSSTDSNAAKICSFVGQVDSLLHFREEIGTLHENLPGGFYTETGLEIRFKLVKLNEKEWKAQKPYRDYIASLKDTLNNYIEQHLNSSIKRTKKCACNQIFFIYFSSDNKIYKISPYDKPNTFAEKWEVYKCKHRLTKGLRHLNLDFVHAEIGYKRQVHWDCEKGWIVHESW